MTHLKSFLTLEGMTHSDIGRGDECTQHQTAHMWTLDLAVRLSVSCFHAVESLDKIKAIQAEIAENVLERVRYPIIPKFITDIIT